MKPTPKTLFLLLMVAGVAGMWLGEIWPARFYWVPALAMGAFRAYIVVMGPTVQGADVYSDQHRAARVWSWTSLALFAAYLGLMYRTDLGNTMHIALQCLNIMLMGAESTFGQFLVMEAQKEIVPEQNEIVSLKEHIVKSQYDFEQAQNEIVSLKEHIVKSQYDFESRQNEIVTLKKQIVSLQKADNLLRRESVDPVRVSSTHQVIRCPECSELVSFGNAAKEVHHCGKIIYTPEPSHEPILAINGREKGLAALLP